MLDLLRQTLHRAIATPVGDGLAVVRVPKDLARRANALLGEPLCDRAELDRRRHAHARLTELRAKGAPGEKLAREQAPVMVYHLADRNPRALVRLKELLDAKGARYTLLDVWDDQATKEFVCLQAKCKEEELPIVFVGGKAIGGYDALAALDAAGTLDQTLA